MEDFYPDDDYSAHAEMLAQCEHEDLTAARYEFEERTVEVACAADYCGMVSHGTAQELERRFWQIGSFSAFCPNHNPF